MIQLELSDSEKNHLIEALESYLSDLRYEIADTDSLDFREKLKEKKAALEKVLAALKASA